SPKPGAPTQPGSPASAKPSRLPDPAFQLEFGIEVDNIFNTVNPGIPVGVLSSPLFGRSLSLTNFYTQNNASNRTHMFHAKFAF
ncbi:MAG TPA: hypothetical protein VM865_07915, partial [Acidobacteriaceae bacterium]|nr:hypothetical protein [Acidobacteriaceae bacterium]